MRNERLESALTWCKRNNESKKKHVRKNQDRVKTIDRPKNLSNY